jgi:HPt (histidine-containing phosphotransfer) domain-containing protein
MSDALIDDLRQAGVDTVTALNRFMDNKEMYEHFLLKFPADDNFSKIKPAFESKNYEEALAATHTIKGVSGNLGMDRLYKATSNTVTLIRESKYAEAEASYQEIKDSYEEVVNIIAKYSK